MLGGRSRGHLALHISETQGCDIHKNKAKNIKAGFTNPAAESTNTQMPYAGQWVSKSDAGTKGAISKYMQSQWERACSLPQFP